MTEEGTAGAIAATNGGGGEIDPTQIDANELAQNMAKATDEQLAEVMAGPMRGQILDEIFRRMAAHFRAGAARDTEAILHWRIGGREDGEFDRYETVIRDGACEAHAGYEHEDARVTFTIGGADFLKLVTGNAAGPTLFMTGKLKIKGDMMFAASTAGLFTIPGS